MRTYIHRLFTADIVGFDECLCLQDWDDAIVEEIVGKVLAQRRWGAQSRRNFLKTWNHFIKYCRRRNLVSEAGSISIGPLPPVPIARTKIVTPQEMDQVISACLKAEPREGVLWAAAVVLAFYAGLRASEIVSLTLADIYLTETDFWIYIWGGKTRAARRAIPLHMIAPLEARVHVSRAYLERREEFPARIKVDGYGLFGPYGDHRAYTRQSLIEPAKRVLQEFLGNQADFHLLRHSCASWLILRREAARDLEFREKLVHGGHPVFEKSALADLRRFLRGPGPKDDPGLDYHQIARLMGHNDLSSLIVTYGHTLSIVHRTVVDRVSK